jgi:uncharacterized protein (DUF1501 family)
MCKNPKKHQNPNSVSHNEEHEAWNRRSFIQALGIAGLGSISLGTSKITAAVASPLTTALNASDNERSLVLIRLKGGNDGLNTIVPLFDFDTYAAQRPDIHLPKNNLYPLSENYGLPDFMEPLQSMWGEGQMKVVHGVGYEKSSLSHFRSSDIWASTVATEEVNTGWMGRLYDQEFPNFNLEPPAVPPAIQIGSLGNLAFDGEEIGYAFSVANPEQLNQLAQNGWQHDVQNVPDCLYGEQLSFLRAKTNTTFKYAGVIHDAYEASATQTTYGNHDIGSQLSIVARLIKGNLGTKVYMVTLGGFDTHANQINRQAQQMQRLSESVKAFFEDLTAYGIQDEVLCMSISEFGRRVNQNGSQGTDHGTAAPVMLFGGGLQGNGFIGNHPSLTDLDVNGNMKYSTDFRDIYSSILTDWLCIPESQATQAMYNVNYPKVDLGFNCKTASTPSIDIQELKHIMLTQQDQNILRVDLDAGTKITVRIYNMLGQEIGKMADGYFMPGRQEWNVKSALGNSISAGSYIYSIKTSSGTLSKPFIVR